jgi:hypothetical protein
VFTNISNNPPPGAFALSRSNNFKLLWKIFKFL